MMSTDARQDVLMGLARRIGWGRNSLRRPVDRAEGVLVVLVWLASVVIALAGIAFGVTIAESDLATSAQQASQLRSTTGVMLENSVAATGSTAMKTSVQVRYSDLTGSTRTGEAAVSVGLSAGTTVPVWLDQKGAIAPTPPTPGDAIVTGIVAGVTVVAGAEGLLLAVQLFVHWRMERRKFAAIDLEWAQLTAR